MITHKDVDMTKIKTYENKLLKIADKLESLHGELKTLLTEYCEDAFVDDYSWVSLESILRDMYTHSSSAVVVGTNARCAVARSRINRAAYGPLKEPTKPEKRRGRPPKNKVKAAPATKDKVVKKRGRPRKDRNLDLPTTSPAV